MTGVSDSLLYLSSTGEEAHSPPSDGLSPTRRSASPEYDSNPERPSNRKRANTTSSGNGEKRVANKICRVCGDKAFSYNFNVITCESCKAFFRRNANKEKEIRCPFNEQCEINVVSRRFCQRCRLAKCFEVGMKKEWIMSDEARLEKKQRVEENRERRLMDAKDSTSPQQRERLKSESHDYSNQGNPCSSTREYRPEEMMFSATTLMDDESNPKANIPMVAACNAHSFMEGVQTTSAHSLADVSSTTSNAQTMDVDPSTTMSSSGFIPPTIDAAALLPVSVTNAVESSLMAQAQLAAAQVQVQAAINHQHQQIAAAVVAHQVAAHMAAAPPPPPAVLQPTALTPLTQSLPPTLPSALPPPILAPPMPSQPPPIMHPVSHPPQTEMVTIPREILVKLIENNTMRAANCKCTCVCGRYPPGSVIVDEVTKDLVAAGGSANNCNSCDTKDEAKLETAEDFQRNGLLPSDDSSVQWLNSSQPTVVDPSVIMDPDTTNPAQVIFESQQQSALDSESWLLSSADREALREIEESSRIFQDLTRNKSRYGDSNSNGHLSDGLGVTAHAVSRALANMTSFSGLNLFDRIAIIQNGVLPYAIIRCARSVDVADLHWKELQRIPQALQIQQHCLRLLGSVSDDVRGNETIVSLLSLILLFQCSSELREKAPVLRIEHNLTELLKRLLFTHCHQDASRARAEFRGLIAVMSAARGAATVGAKQPGCDPQAIEAALLIYA